MLLALPSVVGPLFVDDVLHRLVLEGIDFGLATRPSQLYAFVPRDTAAVEDLVQRGVLPWWTAPDLAVNFYRPLTSATIALDHWIAPWNAPVAHFHSLLWTGALVLAVGRLHRNLVPERAGLATFVYALAMALAFCVAWISARHTLLTATFSVLAIERWISREGEVRSLRDELLGAGFFLLALASGEGAAGAPLFLGALTFARPTSWWSRARQLVGPAALLVIYFALYAGTGGGARGSGGYLDPMGAPVASAIEIVLRALAFVTDCYLSIPSDAAHGGALLGYAGLGVALLVALGMAARHTASPRRLLALIAAALVASLPGTLGFYGGRVLLLSLCGSSAAVALLIDRALAAEAPTGLRRLASTLAVFLLVLSPVIRAGSAVGIAFMSFESRDAARRSREACEAGAPMLVLGASDPAVAIYTPLYWVADDWTAGDRTPPVGELRLLTMAPLPLVLTRTGERSVRVVPAPEARGELLAADWEHLYRRDIPEPLEVRLPDATVRWSRDAAGVGGIEYTVESAEAWEATCMVRWDGRALVRVTPPAIGEEMPLPWSVGPMGM